MLTLHAAAALLAASHSATGSTAATLAPLASAAGFDAPPLPLEPHLRAALGLGDVPDAAIVRGGGALRALLLDLPPDAPVRDAVAAAAARLTTRAPHLLWLVLALEHGGRQLAVATCSAAAARPRVAALIVDRHRVVPSDAETVCALASAAGGPDVLVHARWLDVLGREALTRRFYRMMEHVVAEVARLGRGAAPADRRELALLYVSRLLFLSFLEAKGWLDGDRRFLERGFEACVAAGGGYHGRVLRPLFFGTLNTPVRRRAPAARAFGRVPFLNGGLFARGALERRCRDVVFPDEALGLVFGNLLTRYRFTAREDSAAWSEAAIDPEMLGKAFESLMAAPLRRDSGAFYTPQSLVAAVTRAALAAALAGDGVSPEQAATVLGGSAPDAAAAAALTARLAHLTVVDPACGSGAFLVHALEELSALAARLGDPRPRAEIRRSVLTRSIFGVDVNPTAVWLCELRLWLSVVIESEERDPLRVAPLPNLDRHVRVGDSLGGDLSADGRVVPGAGRVTALRERYARATGVRKRTLDRVLDRAERRRGEGALDAQLARACAARRELLAALRGRDLFGRRRVATAAERARLAADRRAVRELRAARRRLREGGALPFSWATHFPDVFARGGFRVAVGNPPWVRLHRIPQAQRAALRARYEVFGHAPWQRGAALAGAGPGFAAQVDLAALFAERSLALLSDGGVLALLLPAKMWRSLAGGGLRRLLAERALVLAVEDWSESPPAFDAAVYPSLLVARRVAARTPEPVAAPPVAIALHRTPTVVRWEMARGTLALDEDPAAPWVVLPTPVRSAFDRVTRAGVPLADSHLGRPLLGVKCGCNEAFVVSVGARERGLATVLSGGRTGVVEEHLLRPLLRGEALSDRGRGTAGGGGAREEPTREHIIWTHAPGGAPLDRLPPCAERWLAHWQRRLRARTDVRGGMRWWTLFRTAGAATAGPRVVWADLGRAPHARVLAAGDPTVPLNSCYVLPCRRADDALAFAALLRSPLAAAWLNALAEPARGGYRRYLAWTVALLPVPTDWASARATLAPLGERNAAPDELLGAALAAYRLDRRAVEPLLAWCAR